MTRRTLEVHSSFRRAQWRSGFTIALILGVCGCSSSNLNLYARPNGMAPSLSGKTVALLPPIAFGGDPVNAVLFDRTNETVFKSRLGSVRFVDARRVQEYIGRTPGAVEALERWYRQAERRRFFPAEGQAVLLHDGKKPLSNGAELKQKVQFRSGGGATQNLLPGRLDPGWFGALDADYVLASMSYTKYREESGIYALFGILPFGGYSYGGPADVRAHYAIYNRRTGQRVWEAYFGVETRKTAPGKWPQYPLDPRTGTALVAAWTLTRDIENALIRLLEHDPRMGTAATK